MKAKISVQTMLAVVLALALMGLAGCNNKPANVERSDAQVAGDVQAKISGDSALAQRQISINANKGVVTLSGNVNSDTERSAASNDAAQVDGVKQVLNNLQVATAAAPMPDNMQMAQNEPPPPEPRSSRSSSASRSSRHSSRPQSSNKVTTHDYSQSASNNAGSAYTPAAPAPPSKVTVPAGTVFQVRTIEGLSSERSQPNDSFHGTLNSEVMVGDTVAIPAGADVQGRVVDAKSAGHYSGQAGLVLELTKVSYNGHTYSVVTDQWTKQGTARGKNTAEKVGGGAAVGAILGGIFGGAKGAAIGATAGAGAGGAANTVTRGQQVELRPESLVTFRLQNPISVTPGSSNNMPHGPRIEPSDQQSNQ